MDICSESEEEGEDNKDDGDEDDGVKDIPCEAPYCQVKFATQEHWCTCHSHKMSCIYIQLSFESIF